MRWTDFLSNSSQFSHADFQSLYRYPAVITSSRLKRQRPELPSNIARPTRVSLLVKNILEDPDLHSIYFIKEPTFIGRDSSCHIAVEDEEISRKHAQIKYLDVFGGKWAIHDCCSKNGTYVNSHRVRVAPQLLADFDAIHLGRNTTFLFRTAEGLWSTIESHRKQLLEACFV